MTEPVLHARRDFFLAAFTLLVTMTGTTLPTPLYTIYQQQLGFGDTWVTIIFAIYALGVTAALLAVGSWSDQLGRRPILFAGLGIGALSTVIFLCTDSISGLLIGRLVSGVSAGIMTGTGTVAILELAPKAWRKSATLAATAANMFALGFGPLLAGITSEYLPYPLKLAFGLHLVLLLIAVPCVYLIRETVKRADTLELKIQKPSVPASVRALFWPAAIAGLAAFSVAGLFTSMVPSIMHQLMHQTHGVVIGAVICSLFVASILGQASLQWLPKPLHMTLGCIGLMAGMVALGLSIATEQMPLLLVASLVAGIGHGMVFRAGMAAVTAASPPDQKAAVTSALFIMFYIGISVPVIAVGISVHAFSLQHVGEFFASVVAVIALLALVGMKWAEARHAATTATEAQRS